MKFITQFSMRNTFVILLAIILIAVGGVYSGYGIKEEAMPNISIPVVTIFTVYPGAAPNDVAINLTRPIQKSLSGIQGIDDIKGISNANVSIVVAQLDYSADVDKGLSDIQEAVNKVTLPQNSQKPSVSKITMGSFAAMTYTIESNQDINELTKFVNSKLQPDLSGVLGVSSINVQGLKNSNVYIKLDAQKLKDNNLTLQSVQNFINANNISFPVGNTQINQKDLAIRVTNQYSSINNIKSIPIIIPPNTTQIMMDSFSKVNTGMTQMGDVIAELGKSMGQLGHSMGQLANGVGTSNKVLSQLLGNNTQSIALLSIIQQQEGIVLSQQAILNKPESTPEEKQKAAAALNQANTIIQSSSESLQNLMLSSKQISDQMSNSASATTPKPMSNITTQAPEQKPSTDTAKPPENTGLKVIFLKDISEIVTGDEAAKYFTRSNFKSGIILNIYKTDDANVVDLSKNIESKIKEISSDNKNIKFNKINDSSKAVKDSINGMMKEGIIGALFAMLIIALFLRNIKSTIISIVSIPLSILIVLIMLPRFNITLNTMSLGGIAVAVGRIVDDSIVVIENIYRRLSLSKDSSMSKDATIEDATYEVGKAVAASTITTVGVFLPLSFISGLIGKVFIPFAYTVVICILASLLVSLTVVPVMSKFMLNTKKIKHIEKESLLSRLYKKLLSVVLNHRLITLILCLALLGTSGLFLEKIGIQFMPSSDSNIVNIKLTMPIGSNSNLTNEEALKFENYLKSIKDIENVASIVGDTSSTSNSPLSNQSSNVALFTVVLKQNDNLQNAIKELRTESKKYNANGKTMTVTPQSISGTQNDNVEVIINGNTIDDISKTANAITEELKSLSTLNNVNNNISQKRSGISITVDPVKSAEKGMNPASTAILVRNYLSFSNITTINQSNSDNVIDVKLGFNAKDIDSVEKIKNLDIQGATEIIKLGDISKVVMKDEPASISELNNKQYSSVIGDITIADTNTVVEEVNQRIDQIKSQFPEGVTYSIQGSNKSISEGFSQMLIAIIVAIFLVFIIMVITFGEPITPFAILFSLPFAGVGAIAALYFAKQALTVSGMIGILMLIGIVVTNAIVLLDRVKSNEKSGMSIHEALLEAGSVRLRPILMTALCTVMALIPLALGFSNGNLISQGLGIAVLGGLLFSTILTLIIVPVMYSILKRGKRKVSKSLESSIQINL